MYVRIRTTEEDGVVEDIFECGEVSFTPRKDDSEVGVHMRGVPGVGVRRRAIRKENALVHVLNDDGGVIQKRVWPDTEEEPLLMPGDRVEVSVDGHFRFGMVKKQGAGLAVSLSDQSVPLSDVEVVQQLGESGEDTGRKVDGVPLQVGDEIVVWYGGHWYEGVVQKGERWEYLVKLPDGAPQKERPLTYIADESISAIR